MVADGGSTYNLQPGFVKLFRIELNVISDYDYTGLFADERIQTKVSGKPSVTLLASTVFLTASARTSLSIGTTRRITFAES